MSSKKWDEINFNSVPGGAMKKYTKAFYRHQEERFNTYLDALKNGKKITVNGKEVDAKINTKKLYPYEIIEKYTNNCGYCRSLILKPELEAMWGGLKDWLQGAENNNVVIADVSGSMYGRPMNTSVGLAIYFSEKNSGPFHNKFMTFSSNPTWISLNDKQTLAEKIGIVSKADWGGSTNIKAALDLILQVGLENNLSQEDMPKTLTIITDMEFDICTNGENKRMTFYDLMKDKYAKNGYQIPEIVFWNVNARNDTFHANAFVKNVRMVSGQATSVFKTLIDGKTHTPYEFMLEVVYADRYDSVVTKKHY